MERDRLSPGKPYGCGHVEDKFGPRRLDGVPLSLEKETQRLADVGLIVLDEDTWGGRLVGQGFGWKVRAVI